MSRGVLALACLLLLSAPLQAKDSLPKELARAAQAHGVQLDQLGLYVHVLGEARPRIAYRADLAMNPASTMKLVTTGAALHLLGPAFNWRTQAWIDGTVHNGTLTGNLILEGAGDPKLTLEEFWLLLRQIRARGVQHIAGDLQLDRTLFQPANGRPEDFDGDGLRPYNALPDALLVNFNAVRLEFTPSSESAAVDVAMHPSMARIQIDNRLQAVDGPCDDWPQDPVYDAATVTLTFSGPFPRQCGATTRNYSPLAGSAYVDALFRVLWSELGGSFSGRVTEAATPPNAQLIATQESEPLAEIIRDINKFSNNVMARQLFLALAAGENSSPLGRPQATQALRQWLIAQDLRWSEFVVDNGSGLSRAERITPRHLGEFLLAMAKSPLAPEFIASLPLSGIDGTMRKRLQDSTAAGRAHIKTGYLQDVRTSAGYVHDAQDRLVVIACFVNGTSALGSKPFHDMVIEWAHAAPKKRGCCR